MARWRDVAGWQRLLSTARCLSVCVVAALATGCLSPLAMHRAVLEYDRTIHRIEGEMLLLNIARAKQGQPLHFTAVSNVAATFDFRTNGGFGSQIFDGGGAVFAKNFFTFTLGGSMAENPTVSIIPVQGEDFTKRILMPMDETKFEFLLAQGVEPAIVLRLMARGVAVESEGRRTFSLNMPHRGEEYVEFRRRVLHLSALNLTRSLHVGPVVFEEAWPLPLDHPLTAQALDKGYEWMRDEEQTSRLARRVVGRLVITNYDVRALSNHERKRLHDLANRYPRNYVLVDVRPGSPGGDYPWQGQIKLRSFKAALGFLARGIADEPECHVEPDSRTGPVLRNPTQTLRIRESDRRLPDSVFTAELAGRWFAVDGTAHGDQKSDPWDLEAFELLNQLYQMTVTDVARVPTLPITIAK